MLRRSFLALICLIVCSSFIPSQKEAKDAPTVVPVPTSSKLELKPVEAIPPEPELRKVERTSPVECAWFVRVCVSEGNFNYIECEKILQTLENMKTQSKAKSLLSIMYAQSPQVTRQKPFADTRSVWVSYLPMEGKKPPAKGWIECIGKNTPVDCTGTWNSTVKEWIAFREKAKALYYSGIVPNLVPGFPIQWGGDMDYWRGVDRKFCPLNEGNGMLNTFWADPKDSRNEGYCLPIDQGKVVRSKTITASIVSRQFKQRARISELSN